MLRAWIAGTRYTQRRTLEALQEAAEAITIAEPRGYLEWTMTARLLAGLAQATLQPDPAVIGAIRAAFAQFDAAGVGLNASWHRWGAARASAALQDWDGAQTLIDEARRWATRSEETRLLSELDLLEASLPQHQARADDLLAAALQRAEASGDVATALRAAAAAHHRAGRDTQPLRAALGRLDGAIDAEVEPGWMQASMTILTKELRHET